MLHARWIGLLIITVAVVVSPVVAVTAAPPNATSPTDELNIDGDSAGSGEQARSTHLPDADAPRVQASADSSLVDIDPAALPGNGTPDSPYIITNASELQAMEDNVSASYRLGTDIDASDTMGWDGTNGFDPIGNDSQQFSGTFDGAGYTIAEVQINRSSSDHVGLFGYLADSGRISNVTLTNLVVNGSNNVGGLVGRNEGTVSNAFATGTVTGSRFVGGLIGLNAGPVRNAFITGTVTGSDSSRDVGGLVGLNDIGGRVRNASATATVTGSSRVGGLVGYNIYGTISNAFATGTVRGSNSVGGLIGANANTVRDSYWDVNTTGQPTSSGGTGLTTTQMTGDAALTNMTGLTFGTVWQTRPGGYPVLNTQPTDPIEPPRASLAVSSDTPDVGMTISFNGSDSTDPDGTITAYEWDLTGDGSIDETGETVSYTYSTSGDYTVSLTVTDDDGVMNTTTLTVTVREPNTEPEASFTVSPGTPDIGSTITVDASASMDPDGTITSYEWDLFNNGSTDATGPTASVAYSEAGEYTVSLIVSDDDGASAETTRVVSVNAPPTAQISVTPTDPEVGQEVTFTASASTDPDGSIETYQWDLTGNGAVDATGSEITRTYESAGTVQVTLTVIDDDGSETQDQIELTVQPAQTTTPGGTETTTSGATETTAQRGTETTAPSETETTAPGDATTVAKGTETTAPGGTESDETTTPETSTDATQTQGPDNTETQGPGQPGFGIGAAIAGIGGAVYILKRRLNATDDEQ